MRRRRLLPLALLLVLGLFLAACGDDDGGSVDAGDTSSEGSDSGDTGDSEAEDAAESAAEDAIGAQLGEDCAFLAQFAGAGFADAFDPTALMTPGGTTDFGAMFQPLAEEFGEAADAAPDEIKDSFQLLADAFADLVSELEGVSIDFSDPQNVDPEALAKLETLGETFDSAELQAASDEVEAWISENCDGALGG